MAENTLAFGSPPVMTLEIKRRLYPDSESFEDRNTLAVNVTVAAGRFHGFLETHLRADELARLRDIFRGMYKHLRGEWHHEFLGSGLEFRIEGDGLGHFKMLCIADDQRGIGDGTSDTLTFGIGFDQTEIPEMLKSLDEVMAEFPVRHE